MNDQAGQGIDPAAYEAWYHQARGCWIGDIEFKLLYDMLQPRAGSSLLDVGCGTGYFSRRFAGAGLRVTGIDPDRDALYFAEQRGGGVTYCRGSALNLPYADCSFDYCGAVTSLCFVANPQRVIAEMLRVSRGALILGLLNRRSLLYYAKHGRGGYRGARWDRGEDVHRWLTGLGVSMSVRMRTAVFFPGGTPPARVVERLLPQRLPWGGFLAVCAEVQPV